MLDESGSPLDALEAQMAAFLDRERPEWEAADAGQRDVCKQSAEEILRGDEAAFAGPRRHGYRETENTIRPRLLTPRRIRRAGLPVRRRPSCIGRPRGRRARSGSPTPGSPGGH